MPTVQLLLCTASFLALSATTSQSDVQLHLQPLGILNAILSLCVQASKQVLDRILPHPVSYADLCAIAGAVGVYATHGPLMNVGYGRPDVDGPDPFQGVGSNTNQQRDYPIQEIIDEWRECSSQCITAVSPLHHAKDCPCNQGGCIGSRQNDHSTGHDPFDLRIC